MLTTTSQPMLAPSDLARYVEFHGWSRGAPYGEDSYVYVSGRGEMIVLPSNVNARDYPSLADQAIRALADLSDIDQRALYDEIKRFDRDTIRIRAISNDTKDGSIDLENGKLLIENSWGMLKTLARDVKKSAGLKKRGIEQLLEGFRLGQTEVGSYAVAITTPPVPRISKDQTLSPPHRHISERLDNALNATIQLADARARKATDIGSHTGLSAAWCSGLADMVEPFERVEIGLTWARTAPRPQTGTATFNSANDVQMLRRVAENLRPDDIVEVHHNVNITGYVEVLKHPEPANSPRTVTIKAAFYAKDITISAVLNPDDYGRACRANEAKANVIVSGSRLIKKARMSELEGARIEAVIASINPKPAPKDQSRMDLTT